MKKFKINNVKMNILGTVREIPEVILTKYKDGSVAMSFDEYRRIEDYVSLELKRQRKVQ